MIKEDKLIIHKEKSTKEWTIETPLKMKDFYLEDYGHTVYNINNNYLEKVKEKYKDKCGKIEFKFSQCFSKVTITGGCSGKDADTKAKNLEHEIIRESTGLLEYEDKDMVKDTTKLEDSFFNEYLKNGISIHVRYSIKDCGPPPLPPGPKPKPKPEECTYEALIKFKLKGHCMLEREKGNLGPLYDNLKKKLKAITSAESGGHTYEVSIYDPGTSDEHLLKESHIEPDATSKKSVAEAEEVIRRGKGSSFGKRKSIIKRRIQKKVIKKRFSKC